jgi:hypothetical protein
MAGLARGRIEPEGSITIGGGMELPVAERAIVHIGQGTMASTAVGVTMRGEAGDVGITLERITALATTDLGLMAEANGTAVMRTPAGFAKASTPGDIMGSGITTDRDNERRIGTDTATAPSTDSNKVGLGRQSRAPNGPGSSFFGEALFRAFARRVSNDSDTARELQVQRSSPDVSSYPQDHSRQRFDPAAPPY